MSRGLFRMCPVLLVLLMPVATVQAHVDVQPDGQLAATSRGALRINLALRERFDYHLTTRAQRDSQQLLKQLKHDLARHLPPRAQQQALSLFGRYRGYCAALAELRPLGEEADIAARLQLARQLRADYFSPVEIAAWFGEADRYDFYSLARRTLLAGPATDRQALQLRLVTVEGMLPIESRRLRQASLHHLNVMRSEQTLRQNGAGSQEIDRWRQQHLGAPAAMRLAQLDREQQDWQQRLSRYQQARRVLSATIGVASAGYQVQLDALRASMFSPPEQLRLAVLTGE
jgi:lipase chaperone LimK